MILSTCACLLAAFNMNLPGGDFAQFNRLMLVAHGAEHVYSQYWSTNLVTVHVQGVRTFDNQKVDNNFVIIQRHGTGFIVRDDRGEVYKVGNDDTSQILSERITADVGTTAETKFQVLRLDSEYISDIFKPHVNDYPYTFISGQLEIDSPERIRWKQPPSVFPTISISGKTAKLEAAPIDTVIDVLGEQYVTGELHIKIIKPNQ